MSSEAAARNNSHYPEKEAVAVNMAADLLAAASEGWGDEVIGILEVDSELLRVGDFNGDTVLHLLVSGGYVEPLLRLLIFMLEKNPKVLKEVAKQGNAQGDTALHLAYKTGHKWIKKLLCKVEFDSYYIKNDNGMIPRESANEMWQNKMLLDEITNKVYRLEDEMLSPKKDNKDTDGEVYEHLLNELGGSYRYAVPCSSFSDIHVELEFKEIVNYVIYEGKILEMLEVDPNLIQYKNWRGETMLHELAYSGDLEVLTKLVGQLVNTSRITLLSLLLKGDYYGCTPLHQTIKRGNMEVSRYLMEVAPEAAFRVNNDGESALYVAIEKGYDEVVKYMLQVMPEASMSAATRTSLLTLNKSSLPHAAIRFRNLALLEMILDRIPSLKDSLDDKGWKPLSYAAYKGYLDEVDYLLKKFPESVMKFDSDGSLPIHKAVSGGQVCIVKVFISIHPQTLYSIDKKGRNILHIVVKCRKHEILSYLKDKVKGVEKLFDLRDNDGKTFADYAPRNN